MFWGVFKITNLPIFLTSLIDSKTATRRSWIILKLQPLSAKSNLLVMFDKRPIPESTTAKLINLRFKPLN